MKPKFKLEGVARVRFAVACVLLLLAASLQPARAQTQPLQDFGDAPAPYPTLLKDNGARHTALGPLLGIARDTESDGQPNAFALGDDNNGVADEDGVIFLGLLVPGQTATVQVTASATAKLDAWLDFGADGSWAETIDHIFTSKPLIAGVNMLTFSVPAGAKIGATFARFRLSTAGDLNFTGAAQDGEVEDYQIAISEPMDFGDAPTKNYPTLLSQNGARHRIIANFMLGSKIDSEPDGQPNATATGDDTNPANSNDEDGITFTSSLVAGSNATVQVVCTMGANQTGKLNAWIDFNADGTWTSSEQIFTDVTVRNGATNLTFAVPSSASGGLTFARFRLSVDGKLGPGGYAPDGEVEDYQISITAALDYGDAPAPYPTTLKDNGARHIISTNLFLGTLVDGETDGQPDVNAKGDDNNGINDEDGVSFSSSIVPGGTATLQVFVTGTGGAGGPAGFLNAWLDFNRDGDWAAAGEQIFTNLAVFPGANSLSFRVPAAAIQGSTFARFRLNRQGGLSFTGLAADGEVEDYQVNISADLDYGDAPKPYPTLLADNGARHDVSRAIHLGVREDSEPDGQPNATATGDDLNGVNDDDGVAFTSLLVPGASATVQVIASVQGLLHAWIDFDGNGSWADAGEKVFNGTVLIGGVNNLSFSVPAGAKPGRTFARFRFTTQTGPVDFVGRVSDGEVEDYQVSITPDRERCDLDCEGRDFWLTFPGNYAPDLDNPPLLSLCIHGAPGTAATVSIPGIGFTTTIVIPATQALTVPLPRAAELGDLNEVITNIGIHVVASAPVGITAFNHARYTTDSYLALNSSVIGMEYIVLGYGNVHSGVPLLNGSQFAIVASESNTVVLITPSVTTGLHPAGVTYNLVLQAGEAYQLRNTNDAPADLSGTIIKSDKPVAVFGSHQNTTIPSASVWFQDYVVEQLLPVNTWGNDFYTAPLATRSLGDTFRFLAAYDGTTVFLNGLAAATLNRGQFYQTQLSTRSHITSDQPIFVAQYATSGDYDGNTNADPFMLTVQSTRHYMTSYRVCTPTNDFPTNYVHLIAPTSAVSTIQIDGVPVGATAFLPIAGTFYSAAQVLISPGTHAITGGAPFAASVYGWSAYDSYGHPACFYFGDVSPPKVGNTVASVTASVNDYPNTPGFVPVPNLVATTTLQDNCDQQLRTATQTPLPGSLIGPGVQTITVRVTDSSGNMGQTNIAFTVLDPSPVIIDCPPNIVANCNGKDGATVTFKVPAHTTYDPNVPVVSTPPSGSFFPIGTTTVNTTATSLAGQSNSCSFTVTVVCNPTITIVLNRNSLTLSWPGIATLETTTDLGGPWRTVVSGVTSYVVPLTGAQGYFRVRYSQAPLPN